MLILLVLVLVVIILVKSRSLRKLLRPNKFFHLIFTSTLLKNVILSGLVVMFGNILILGLLFLLTIIISYFSDNYGIDLLFNLVPLIGILLSLWFWQQVGITWYGINKDRIVLSLIGSSVYWIISIFLIIILVNLDSQSETNDSFMSTVGLFMGILISIIAGTINIAIINFVGLSQRRQ